MYNTVLDISSDLRKKGLCDSSTEKAAAVAEAHLDSQGIDWTSPSTLRWKNLSPMAVALIGLSSMAGQILVSTFGSHYIERTKENMPLSASLQKLTVTATDVVLEDDLDQRLSPEQMVMLSAIRKNDIKKLQTVMGDESLLTFVHVHEAARTFQAGKMPKADFLNMMEFMFNDGGLRFADTDIVLARHSAKIMKDEINTSKLSKSTIAGVIVGTCALGVLAGGLAMGALILAVSTTKNTLAARKNFKNVFRDLVQNVSPDDRIKIYQAFAAEGLRTTPAIKKFDPKIHAAMKDLSL